MSRIGDLKNKILLREGHWILFANLADKVVNFLIMIIAARYMSLATYGYFSYIKSIVTALTPFSGLGGSFALLRFGMDTSDLKIKYNILFSALFFGSVFTLLFLMITKIVVNYFSIFNHTELKSIFDTYILFVLSYFIYDIVRNYYRIVMDNRTYAINTIRYSVLTLIFGSLSLIVFDYLWFLVTIVLLPVIITMIDNRKILFGQIPTIKFEKPFWKYGILISLGAFLNQFFMQSDILVLGFINTSPELIAQYKVATLLVYTFIFIPNTFLIRDFALLSENARNKSYLVQYAYTYLKYSLLMLILAIPLFYIISNNILVFLFGEKFENNLNIQNILVFGLVGIVLLRILFGNILNAVGKANLNVINAIITIVLALPTLYLLTKSYGIVGTAYAMVIVFFCSGIISLGMFMYYIKGLKG